jgi:hypothetical protein
VREGSERNFFGAQEAEDDGIFGEVGKRIAQRAAAARARIFGMERYPTLIVAATVGILSLGLTMFFWATGHPLLALLA